MLMFLWCTCMQSKPWRNLDPNLHSQLVPSSPNLQVACMSKQRRPCRDGQQVHGAVARPKQDQHRVQERFQKHRMVASTRYHYVLPFSTAQMQEIASKQTD